MGKIRKDIREIAEVDGISKIWLLLQKEREEVRINPRIQVCNQQNDNAIN